MTQWHIIKDYAETAINGPVDSWHKLPQQAQSKKRRRPGPYLVKFDPGQERDDHGRWVSEGPSIRSLFKDNLGFKRSDMPQIPDNLKQKFLSGLKLQGVKVENETVQARTLKPTQKEFNEKNIEGLRAAFDKGEYKPTNRILVSKDHRILDGHHRWAMLAQKDQTVEAVRIDLPMKDLMPLALKFDSQHKIAHESAQQSDSIKKSDYWDQFESLETVVAKAGNPNHDPKTGEFSGGQPKTDLYGKRNQARVAGDDALKALKEQLRNTKKDDASDNTPAEYNSADGRPKWMQSPGQGGISPVYRSQKPGANGNQDTAFSKNVNENPPTLIPVDADAYYIW